MSVPIITDKPTALDSVTVDGLSLQFLSDDLRKDYDIVEAAVIQNGTALQFASSALKANTTIIYAALTNTESSFEFAAREV